MCLQKLDIPAERDPTEAETIITNTAGLDTIFVQIYMDPSPGVPGV